MTLLDLYPEVQEEVAQTNVEQDILPSMDFDFGPLDFDFNF